MGLGVLMFVILGFGAKVSGGVKFLMFAVSVWSSVCRIPGLDICGRTFELHDCKGTPTAIVQSSMLLKMWLPSYILPKVVES